MMTQMAIQNFHLIPFLFMKIKNHFSPCTGRGLKLNTFHAWEHEENTGDVTVAMQKRMH